MPDERAETFEREAQVRAQNTPPPEIGERPQATPAVAEQPAEPTAVEETPAQTGETPMIPKFRYDELNSKYQALRSQPKPESTNDLDKLVDAKLAPLRVQIETERVLKTYDDFPSFADSALAEIKKNPTLSLEDGYILAKAKSGTLASQAKEQGKNEAYNNIEKKTAASGVTSGRKAEPKGVDELIHDKSVPLSEIAKMLPRS